MSVPAHPSHAHVIMCVRVFACAAGCYFVMFGNRLQELESGGASHQQQARQIRDDLQKMVTCCGGEGRSCEAQDAQQLATLFQAVAKKGIL